MASRFTHPRGGAAAAPHDTEAALMAQGGVTRTAAYHYHVDGYRYTRLADALAQAKRGAGREGTES